MDKYRFNCGCEFEIVRDLGPDQYPLLKFDYKTSFREDCPAVWRLFEQGLNLGVFQLDSPLGIKWTKELRPTTIEHLGAIGAILRPGSLNNLDSKGISVTQHYCDRKNGKEEITYPIKALEAILKDTYGLNIYQEGSIKMGIELAGFTPSEADAYLRKGIGVKDAKLLFSAQEKFIEGCKKVGKVTEAEAHTIFDGIKASARYSFNKCLHYQTSILTPNNIRKPLQYINIGDLVCTPNGFKKVVNKYWNGQKHTFKFTTYRGSKIKCTADHKILCTDGQLYPIITVFLDQKELVSELDGFYTAADRIVSVEYWNYDYVIDIEIDDINHVFFAENLAVSNSHSIAYGIHSFHEMYLKAHASLHFYTSKMKSPRKSTEQEDIANFVYEAKLFDIETRLPDVRHLRPNFYNDGKQIYFGLSDINGLGPSNFMKLAQVIKEDEAILKGGWFEFVLKAIEKLTPSIVYLLIDSGALDWMGLSRAQMHEEYKVVAELTDTEWKNLLRFYNVEKMGVQLV